MARTMFYGEPGLLNGEELPEDASEMAKYSSAVDAGGAEEAES